ncbi:FAD-dependent oxidoreductase [Aquimarina sp. U1-2]|uniref:FAD-dependent oxidoreductase n=1 Tax=Aquimarina sp. U1-2 TaxID=2823141 RepID=UPI001AECC424|nr:FAD-dependent oxidoreductase [Aquimarina sp. U1-2]
MASAIKDILEDEGINILFGASAKAVSRTDNGIALTIEKDGSEQNIEGSDLLVAIGRLPNSDSIGLENTSIKSNSRGYIQVDDYCRTSVDGVVALGDVNGEGAFTHTSVNDAEIVLDHLFGGERAISKRIPIYGLFTDPPLGRVGMSEKEALATGKKVLKATYPLSKIGRANRVKCFTM